MSPLLTARSGLAVELSFSMTAALQAKPLLLNLVESTGTLLAALLYLVCCAEQQIREEREARNVYDLNGLL